MIFDRRQYLKQLNIQYYYLKKFTINYSGAYFKNKCLRFLKELEEEIEVQKNTMKNYKEKYQQTRLDI